MNYIVKISSILFFQLIIALFSFNIYFANSDVKVLLAVSSIETNNKTNDNSPESFWETFLLKKKINYRLVESDDIDSELNEEITLLIVPEYILIDLSTFEDIEEFVKEGGAFLAFGNLFEDGELKESNNKLQIDDFFGITLDYSSSKYKTDYLSLISDTPISQEMTTIYSADINSKFRPTIIDIKSDNTFPISFSESYKNLNFGTHPYKNKYGGVYGKQGKGRFLWMNSGYKSIYQNHSAKKEIKKLLDNQVDWLLKKPMVWISKWPYGKSSAVSVCLIVDHHENISNKIFDYFAPFKSKLNYFINSSSFMDQELFANFNRNAGIYLNHSISLKWQDEKSLNQLLQYKFDDIEDNFSKNINKVFSAFGQYDSNTLTALNKLGVRLLLLENSEVISDNFYIQNLDVYKISGYSNKNLRDIKKIIDPSVWFSVMLNDFYKFNRRGDKYIPAVYLSYLSSPESVEAFTQYMETLESNNCWFATLEEIQVWENKTENIFLSLKGEGENFKLFIDNRNNESVYNLTISLSAKYRFEPEYQSKVIIDHEKFEDGSQKIVFNKLESNQQLFVNLFLENK